jgi:hypothetical protein
MPKFIAHRFEVRRELSGSISLRLSANQKEYRFDIAEHAVPQIREHLIQAFQLVDSPSSLTMPPAAESTPQDRGTQNTLRKFDVTANPGSELISLRFEMATAGSLIDMTLPIPLVEMMFEAIGKGLTIARSEPTGTRQ